MGFAYLSGITTAGAADEVADFFATFQQWITAQIGWTVEAGGGTTDLILRSLGETGAQNKLYVRVWQDGGAPNHLRMEVRDDLAGTHVTNEGGFLDSGGFQFPYYMGGDLDAFYICWQNGANYRILYAGLIMPFARTVADEENQMIVSDDDLTACSILRDSGGVWDVDLLMQDDAYMDDARIDRNDGSLTIGPLFVDNGANLAGQLRNIGGVITDPTVIPGNTIATGQPGATTTWVVIQDSTGARHPIRTGGVMPSGVPAGNFSHWSGPVASYAALYAALDAVLAPIGWTSLGDPGVWTSGNMWYSTGESGLEDIYITYAYNNIFGRLWGYVSDDALMTHEGNQQNDHADPADFPCTAWISADRDCCSLVLSRAGVYHNMTVGMPFIFAPGLDNTTYKMCVTRQGLGVGPTPSGEIVRAHDGTWGDAIFRYEGTACVNSNPNAYDGATYLVWPYALYSANGANKEPIGNLKYTGYSHGGGIASLDTITVGPEVHTVFLDSTGKPFTLRTV
jgi:hypothetical protein